MASQSFKVPPQLEAHAFTGVASSGGGEDWLDVEGLPVDKSVNGFIVDEEDEKVWSTVMLSLGRQADISSLTLSTGQRYLNLS